jgi:hypothetical protein
LTIFHIEGLDMPKSRLLQLAAVLAFASWSLLAQDSTGRAIGTITDPSGALVPNARVTVTNASTGVARTVTTGPDGNFQVLLLPIGPYRARVEAAGFATAETGSAELRINQSLRFDVQMKLGSPNESIRVDGTAAAIETVDSSLGGSVTNETIVSMPLNGRNAMSLIGLQADATEQRDGGALTGTGVYSISGGRTDSVTFLLDGVKA